MALKDLKINYVVDVAISLFLTHSINDVTIKDIADKAEIGEATVYRYFGKKETIILACIMKLQKDVTQNYFALKTAETGFERIKIFYESFLNIFIDHPSYYHFIREFDAFMIAQENAPLADYEKSIDAYKQVYLKSYELGVQDGSIKPIDNINQFYFATTHALLELCKKLSMREGILTQDNNDNKHEEVAILVDIILKSLQNL